MRECAVCSVPSSQWCSGCGNVSYCSSKHQRQDWPRHKSQCGTVRTCHSPLLGNYLVAARDLSPGDLVLDEEVSVLGPAVEEDSQVCLGCYYPSHGHQCPHCSAPLCGPSCQAPSSPHSQECSTLATADISGLDITPFVTALRFLLLARTDLKRYRKCRQLSTNLEQRKDQPDFQLVKERAATFSSLFPGLASEQEIIEILCILDTNTFQVLSAGSASNLAGLYLRVSLLNHSCVPNCRLIFRSDNSLEVRTSVRVRAGEQLNISYTPPFFSVIARNNILHRGKQFLCSCNRCQAGLDIINKDPTELGTLLSSVRCVQCGMGLLQHSGSFQSDWKCSECQLQVSYLQYAALDAKYLGIQMRLDKEDVEEMKNILRKYSAELSPTHALILETKQHLAAALGRVDGYRLDQLKEEDLDLKISISYDLLNILDVLEPGMSKSRGITLLDLSEVRVRKILRNSKNNRKVLDQLIEVEKELSEANEILKYEDEKALEGNVAKKARMDLTDIRKYILSLKQSF